MSCYPSDVPRLVLWSSADVPGSLNCRLALLPRSRTAFPLSLPCVPPKLITFLFVMDLIMQLYKCHLILLLFNSIERIEKRKAPDSTIAYNFISDWCRVCRPVSSCLHASVCVSGYTHVGVSLCVRLSFCMCVCACIFVPALMCMSVHVIALGAPSSLP